MSSSQYSQENFLRNLVALRKPLIRVTIFIIIMSFISLFFVERILYILQLPLSSITDQGLRISAPGEIPEIFISIALSTGFLISIPYIAFEMWLYAAPGLTSREKKTSLVAIPLFELCLVIGIFFGYYLILPAVLKVLYNITQKYGVYDWELIKYIPFVTNFIILSAVSIISPLLIEITRQFVFKKNNINFLILFWLSLIVASAFTSGTAITVDIAIAVFIYLCYLITYYFIRFISKMSLKRGNAV